MVADGSFNTLLPDFDEVKFLDIKFLLLEVCNEIEFCWYYSIMHDILKNMAVFRFALDV